LLYILLSIGLVKEENKQIQMAKKSRGGRMTAAKRRAAKSHHGGKGLVKNRPAGKNIMRT
jgi:hypothetical protein